MLTRSALLIALALGFSASTQAEDKIWTAVVLATNAPSPKGTPKPLRDFEPKLKRIFGYNQFEVIGSATDNIEDKSELRLTPTQSFWIQAKARRATSKEARGGYLLSLQLFKEKRQLVDTEARLAPGSPLFISGPEYGNGRIVFALMIE
jgi:hypothetical protein